jgi:hypothetical protein
MEDPALIDDIKNNLQKMNADEFIINKRINKKDVSRPTVPSS